MDKEKKYRILVIDDNLSIHEDFRKILLRSGSSQDHLADIESELFGFKAEIKASTVFEIDCASQGREGLEMALKAKTEGHPYALAFVDGRMPPGWDGIETINQLWKECPELQVVLCTAYSDYSWQEIRRLLGESDSLLILKKPFDNIEVLQLTYALTRKWELNHQVQQQVEKLDDLVRIRTEEKDQARMLLEAALMHSPAGIIISSEDGTKIIWSNQAAGEIYGGHILPPLHDDAVKGDNLLDAFRPDGTPYTLDALPFVRTIKNEEIVHNEILRLKSNQGRDKWISYNSAPIRDPNGKKIAAIIIFNDISDLKYTEIEHERLRDRLAQMQKMESVGLLAGGVAHDYNNMLSVIIGNAEMGILSTDTPEPILELLNVIKKTAHKSADLTQQLLAFARKQAITPKAFDMNKKITDILKILHRLIGENIDISCEQDTDLWQVKVDTSQFDQILFNLCVNSRDAIDGIGRITIVTGNITLSETDIPGHPELKSREHVMLKVSDTGKGMEKEVLNRIFEPFYTTKELGKGTGLGLSTVYGIVKQNNGYINVESEPGKGTTFTIYLPRFEGVTIAAAFEKSEIKDGIKGKNILMVEDKEDVLFIGKAMLERLGYSVVAANTPEEALIQAEKMNGNIDLLITDVIMPGMNGHDLANKLKSLHPGLKCLYMSGYSADIISEQGVFDESVHFLQKPFTFNTLAPKVEAALY